MKKPAPWEYGLRFVFGGVVAVLAGWIGKEAGPVIGGFFLAFPAILPASLTLLKDHDGRPAAVDDARGARLGSLAMSAFALVVCAMTETPPALALAAATVAWFAVAGALWAVVYGR